MPNSLLVVGGGYIGLELGTVYAALGIEGHGRRNDRRPAAGADRDLVNVLAKRVDAICEAVLLETKVVGMKDDRNGVSVDVRGQAAGGHGQRADVRPGAGVDRPPAQLRRAGPREDRGAGRRARLHRGGRAAADGRADDLSRSATWSASRCSRTRRRTRDAWPSRRSPGTRSRSSRWRFRPSSSPIRSSPGAA